MSYHLIEKRVIFAGKKVRLEVHQLANERGRKMEREVCVHPGAVVILPILHDGSVVLIRNRRYAVGEILVELPAGTLEAGEDPADCAGRELLEETGYRCGRLERLLQFFSSPGILSETLHAYGAYDLEMSRSALEEGEEIEAFATPWPEALAMIRDGKIVDAKTIATLLYFERFHRPGGAPGGNECRHVLDGSGSQPQQAWRSTLGKSGVAIRGSLAAAGQSLRGGVADSRGAAGVLGAGDCGRVFLSANGLAFGG